MASARLVPTNPVAGGLAAHASGSFRSNDRVTQFLYWPLLVREIRRADVVHVFSASYWSFLLSTLPPVLVARLLGRPVIVHYHSGEAPDHLSRSRLARYVLGRLTDAIVVPSRFLQEVFDSFGLPSQTIANTVDTSRFVFRPRAALRPDVLSTRNFEPHYNVRCTLRAFRIVQRRYPSATLTLVGNGSQDREPSRLPADIELERGTLAGRVPYDEIRRFYEQAGIYVQTPDRDNMTPSHIEAFASSVPVSDRRWRLARCRRPGDRAARGSRCRDAVANHRATARGSGAGRADRFSGLPGDRPLHVAGGARAVARALPPARRRGRGGGEALRMSGGVLERVAAMKASELRFRVVTESRKRLERARSAIRPLRWRRENLRLRATTPDIREACRALAGRRWDDAHRALARHYASRTGCQ